MNRLHRISFLLCAVILLGGCTLNLPASTEKTEATEAPGTAEATGTQPVAADRVVRIAMDGDGYPPYEYWDAGGNGLGINFDLYQEAFKRMGREVDIIWLPFARGVAAVESGEVDAISGVYKTEARQRFGLYPEEYNYLEQGVLFVKKGSEIPYSGDLNALKGYTIGMLNGYSGGQTFDAAVADGTLTIEYVQTNEQNIQKLVTGRVDIILNDRYSLLNSLKDQGMLDQVQALEPPLQSEPAYLMFSRKNGMETVMKQYDGILKEMKRDGSYDAILKRYMEE